MRHPAGVEPGDAIWLAGGVYSLDAPLECRLAGSAESPIEVLGDPQAAPAVLDFADGRPHGLYLAGRYAWYSEFEVRCSATARWSDTPGSEGNPRGTGIFAETGLGVRLIRLTVRGFGTSMFESQPSGIEIRGCTFRDSYWDAPDRSHGPGLYIRNPKGAPRKRIEGNVVFHHGRQGLQGFGSTPFSEVDVIGNTFFNNGIARDGFHRNFMFGNATDDHWNVRIEDNVAYFPMGKALGHEANMAGGDGGSHNLTLEGNWIAHGGRPALRAHRAEGVTITNNRFVGDVEYSNLDETISIQNEDFEALFAANSYYFGDQRPGGVWVRSWHDDSLPDIWRRSALATVTVLNWDGEDFANVDLSLAPVGQRPEAGATVEIRAVPSADAALEHAYDGSAVPIPLTGWNIDQPAGRDEADAVPPLFPEMGVFELRWPVSGEAAPREPQRLQDPGQGLDEPAARTERETAWRVADAEARLALRQQRVAYWRSQTLGRTN